MGAQDSSTTPGLSLPLLATSSLITLIAWLPWARRWTTSGAAIESLLLIYGYGVGTRILPIFNLWTLLATFNLAYSVCSTSWLLYDVFAALCYPLIFVTCLCQFESVANFARRSLRRWLRQLHFTKDKIALFNLPALEIDTDVNGLLVVRGLTCQLSSLTIIAHGIELGIRLTDDIEFAISVDKVTIALGRRITIGEVYGNLKDDKVEMMFANQGAQAVPGVNGRAMLDSQSGNLKAAVVGSAEFGDRRQLREQLTGVSYMEEIAPSAVMDPVKLVALDDDQAEKRYLEALDDIHRSSAVGQSQLKVKLDAQSKEEPEVPTDSDVRRAVVIALQNQPSVPHPPGQSIRVTTLQTLAPPKVRRFLHRLPLGLRLMLQPISYLHPITTSCFTCGIPGCYISALLSKEVFKHYSDVSAAVQRLELKIEKWLADANFCVQFGGLNAVTQVPVSTTAEISAQVKVMDVRAYRSVDGTNESAQVAQLDGIDASVNLPMFLLPHHEHIIPPRPLEQQKEAPESLGIKRSGTGFSSVGEKDNADITFNAHASLPARFDESLLSFVAAIVKASKVIELEKEFGSGDEQPITDLDETAEPTSVDGLDADSEQDSIMSTPDSPTKKDPRFKLFAKNIRQNLKDGTTGHSIKVLAKDLNQSTRDSMKKAVVVGVVNDGWIAKVVGKIAAKLEKARGSLGYSGSIPVPLEPYRLTEDGALSKLLP